MPTKKPSAKASKGKKSSSAKSSAKSASAKKAAQTKAQTKVKGAQKASAKSVAKSHAKPQVKSNKPAAKVEAKKPTPSKVFGGVAAKPVAKGAAAPVVAPKIPPKMPPPRPALSPTSSKHLAIAERRRPISTSGDAEDQDLESSTNLLAGPRNVTPYQAKRGEQYMNREQLDHFRNILNTWKHDLMEEVDRTVLHMKDEAANFPDPNDRATQESEFSLELRTRDRERKLIRKIDDALARIEDGSYGYCVETGEEIGIKRLEARPVATLCVEAQERRERRERQYGDRDDRYR
jgi:RNA polymerase-binding transcription factor